MKNVSRVVMRLIEILSFLSGLMIPLVMFLIIMVGILRKIPIYESFVKGAKDGVHTVVRIMPTLIGLMIATGVLRASGFLDFFAQKMTLLIGGSRLPGPVIPLIVMRLFSSSAATGLALDLFREYGTDSYIGLLTSLLLSCTETVLYTMSVYFLAAKVTKSRWTLAGALIATFAGIAASVVLAGLLIT